MPVNEKIMAKLVAEYGPEKGKRVYYAMENEGKIPGMKKPPASKKRGAKKPTTRAGGGGAPRRR